MPGIPDRPIQPKYKFKNDVEIRNLKIPTNALGALDTAVWTDKELARVHADGRAHDLTGGRDIRPSRS